MRLPRAANHVATAPPSNVMNSRLCTVPPKDQSVEWLTTAIKADVRFGSLADVCSAKGHVRFTPNSDRESGFPQKVMSAFPPKADVCGANRHVRFGPKADIGLTR